MSNFKSTNIQPLSFYTDLGFTEAEANELVSKSCVHHLGNPAFQGNRVWSDFGNIPHGLEYSQEGMLEFLAGQPADVKELGCYSDAYEQAVSWEGLSIHPQYETINRIMSERCELFNVSRNETISHYLDLLDSDQNPDELIVLPSFKHGEAIIQDPYFPDMDPILTYGTANYLTWLLEACNTIYTKDYTCFDIPFDIDLFIVPLRKFPSCTSLEQVIVQAKETGKYITQTHSSHTLDFKEMDEGMYEQDYELEAFVCIDGEWIAIGYLGELGIRAKDIRGLSAEFISSIPSMERFELTAISNEVSVDLKIGISNKDYTEDTLVAALSSSDLVINTSTNRIVNFATGEEAARILKIEKVDIRKPAFSDFYQSGVPF